jgi:UDP-glucose 4-epimerase
MKCLVTGGAGFIGSHLTDELINLGHEVLVIDNESAENNTKFYYNEKAKYHKKNIANYAETRDLYNGIDYVFHLAAESKIQPTLLNPEKAFKTNVIGTQIVLQCASEAMVKRVIYSSTSAIYGLINNIPLIENMPSDCLNPYALSKMHGEDICKLYNNLYALPTTILRYFNVYGDRQPKQGPYAPIIALFMGQYENNKDLTITGDGQQTRDFIHVSDVVKANIACAIDKKNINGEVINIGSGENISILDLAKSISEHYALIEKREAESLHSQADIRKARYLLNWHPEIKILDYITKNVKIKK